MRRSTVIFDLDGTLTKPNLDFDVIRAEIGIGQGPILEAMAQMSDDERHRAQAILERYEWDAAQNAELQEGAKDVVNACRRSGVAVAILTRNARPMLDVVLAKHGIEVDAIRTREDAPMKPSPQPVLSICKELSSQPQDCWMVGDYLFDVIAGREAGAKTALLIGDRPRPEYAERADFVIKHLRELLPIIGVS